MSGSDVDAPTPPPPLSQSQTPVVAQAPHIMSTIKLPILKKGEYDVWAMKIEHYLVHTDYPLWEVIQKESKKNKANDNSKRLGKKEESNALMTLDGGLVDWTRITQNEVRQLAFMAITTFSGSNTRDYHNLQYGPKTSLKPSESETQTSEFDTCESNISIETPELVSEPVVNEPNVVCQPKVWSDAPIIEEYESDTDDYCVSKPTKEQEQPSFASTNKQVKTPRETLRINSDT
ncbi:hypothetical protein Tco_0200940 [Tanacetum coccineum]